MRYFTILLSLLLFACSQQQADEIVARIKRNNGPSSAEIRESINAQCAELGAPKGSPSYYNCYTHYEQMFIQAMLAGTSRPPLLPASAFSSTPNVNPKFECETKENYGVTKTTCY